MLIVDQDPEMLRQHTRWLEAAGFEVRQAGNGDQASTMQSRLEDNTVDVQPCVIGCVSRIQEIINDLLAYSRFTGDPGQADDPTFSLPTDRAEQDSDGTTSETGTLPDFADQLTDPSIWFPPGCEPDVLSASEPST